MGQIDHGKKHSQITVSYTHLFYRIGKLREELGVDLAKADTLSLLNCLLILKDQQEIADRY